MCVKWLAVFNAVSMVGGVGMAALNIFTVPAVAIGKFVDGVKKTARKVLLLIVFYILFFVLSPHTTHAHTHIEENARARISALTTRAI